MEEHSAEPQMAGRYHLIERLAIGGMAEVFLGSERGENALDRLVVVKRILPHLAADQAFVDMFLNEARIAARISHPHVVQIYELGEDSAGMPFIAMEYFPGSTLKELSKAAHAAQTRLPVAAVVQLLMQACAGAHAAHELKDHGGKLYGLVHRDLSPHNLMVDDNGHVKLLDFGIAKATEGMDNTRTGMLKGKIAYMSPEQCKQERLDRRSDIFALGIIAWELLVGARPFSGKSELAVMQAIVQGNLPHVRDKRPGVPEPITAAIHRALAVDKDARYDTADEMRLEIREAAHASEVHLDQDRTALLVRTLLGPVHEDRRRTVEEAMERSAAVASLNEIPPAFEKQHTESSASNAMTRSTAVQAGLLASLGGVFALVGLILISSIGAAILLVWSFSNGEPRVTFEGPPVYMSVAPTLETAVLAAEHEPIREYLERSLNRHVVFEIADSYGQASDRMIAGEVPYALIPHNTAVEAHRRSDALQVLATKVVDGSASTDGYLVVKRSTAAKDITALKGETICYSDPLSNTGYKLPRAFIRRTGLDPDEDFTTYVSGDHQQVLRDLISGICSVGGTFSGNYHTADQRGVPIAQLRILGMTGSTPHDAIVAGPKADREVTAALQEALLTFDPMQEYGVERIGESERITGFAPPTEDYRAEEDP